MHRLLAGMFIISLSMGMAGLALPLYARDLGASYTEVGLLGVAYVVFDAIFSMPSGRAGDRRGRKPFLVLGFFLTACVISLYSVASAVIWLITLRLLQGAVEAPIWVNAQSAVADLSTRSERGRTMGVYGTSWAVGFGIGPLIGGFLYVTVGAAVTFLLSALVAFIATVTITGMPPPKPNVEVKKLQLHNIWPACVVGFIYAGIASVILTLFPFYASKQLKIPEVEIGFLITLFAFVRGILFIPMGSLSDRIGTRPVILMGMLASAVASAGIVLVPTCWALAIVISTLAIGMGAIYPALMSMISKASEGRSLGYILGIQNVAVMAGWGIFPGIGGPLADAYSPTSPYLICTAIALVSSGLLWKLLPKKY